MPNIKPERIKQVREALGWTQSQLIRKASWLSKRTIQRIESSRRNEHNIQGETLAKFARVFNCDPRVLTGELPLPEEYANSVQSIKTARDGTTSGEPTEIYDIRLAKLDDEYVVVEFSESNPVGNVIARNIPNEATGLRLTSSTAMRQLLDKAYNVLAEANILDIENYFEEEDYYNFLNDIRHQLDDGPVSLHHVARSEIRTLIPSSDVLAGIQNDSEDAT